MTTHISMDGRPGPVVSNVDQFHSQYIDQVKSGTKLYLVEMKTPLFRFFMDIDYISNVALTHAEIKDMATRINRVIPGPCLVAISGPRETAHGIKSGVHIHFPDLIVTRNKALRLKSLVPSDIVDFIDESVYKGSGLRMLWSYKRDGARPYVPFYNATTGQDLSPEPSVDMLNMFSIRTPFSTGVEPTSDGQVSALELYIQKYIPGHTNTRVKKVVQGHGCRTVHTDGRYCERIHREHKSNHIYFVIAGPHIYQKCFDEECKGFIGRKHKLSPGILDGLADAPVSGYPVRDCVSVDPLQDFFD
jgi:Herpesviridae UL52/UL70 DNA primase